MSRLDLIPALIKAAAPAVQNSQGLPGADHLHSHAFEAHLKAEDAPPPKKSHPHECRTDDADQTDETTADKPASDEIAEAPAADDAWPAGTPVSGDILPVEASVVLEDVLIAEAPSAAADAQSAAPETQDLADASILIAAQLSAQLPVKTETADPALPLPTDSIEAAEAPHAKADNPVQPALSQASLLNLAVAPEQNLAAAAIAPTEDGIAPAAVTAPASVPVQSASEAVSLLSHSLQTTQLAAETPTLPAEQETAPAPRMDETVSLVDQAQPAETDTADGETVAATDTGAEEQAPAQAKGKPDALPEQSSDIAKANFAEKAADKPAPKADHGLHLGHQIVKAETVPGANAPHQYGHQIVHPQHAQPSPVADAQQAARQAVALARVPFEIAVNAHKGEREFEIRLDPPELGKVDVSLSVDKNGKVSTHLVVERTETLDQLRRDAQNLERALQNSGLKTDSNSLQFSLRDQNAQNFVQADERAVRRGALLVEMQNSADIALPRLAQLGNARGLGIDLRI